MGQEEANMETNETVLQEQTTTPEAEVEAKELTFDEFLAKPEFQREFDRRLAKSNETSIANAKAKWERDQAEKIAESQKLAQMDEIQKRDYEIENLKKELSKRDVEKQANDLRNEAIRQANERGIPLEVMTELDYRNETAETINKKIDVYSNAFRSATNNAIESYSREYAPQTSDYYDNYVDESELSYEELASLPQYQ